MSLSVDPSALQLPASGGVSTHQLHNNSAARLAFKVKSTNNDHYRLKPVYGFIEPGETVQLEVTRTEGPIKEDRLVIQFTEASVDSNDAQAFWKGGATAQGDVTLPLSAVESAQAAPPAAKSSETSPAEAAPPAAESSETSPEEAAPPAAESDETPSQ